MDFGNVHFGQTSGALALFAVEVGVHITVGFVVVAHTKLVAHNVVAVFYLMHHVLIAEKCERAESTCRWFAVLFPIPSSKQVHCIEK